MKVLDTHGNYGAVVRFTAGEWESFQTFIDGVQDGEDE